MPADTAQTKMRGLLADAAKVISNEISMMSASDGFTQAYFQRRNDEVARWLVTEQPIDKWQLQSVKNLIGKLAEVVSRRTKYDDLAQMMYAAAVEDLRDELDAACEGRDDFIKDMSGREANND